MNQPLVISYSRTDSPSMLRVRAFLQSSGIPVWSDENLQPGTSSWTKAIQTAIDRALGLVVVLSPNAKGSDWVEKEIRYAQAQRKFVFPVLATGESSTAVPLQLIDAEFIDIRTDFDGGMSRLLEVVRSRLQVVDVESKAAVLRFSAQAPRGISRTTWSPMFVYVYHVSATDAVSEDMAQVADAGWHTTGPQAARGRFTDSALLSVAVSPTSPAGLQFNPQRITVDIYDVWQRFEFWVRAADHYGDPTARVSIGVTLEPIAVPFAEVALELSLDPRDSDPATRTVAKAGAYQNVFACYSREDAAIVAGVAGAYHGLGIRVVQDVLSVRSGSSWEEQLKRMIEDADIFQLFWSRAAARSASVEQEWRYALSLGRQNFVRPIYWEDPFPPPPEELRHLHFARVPLK